MKKIHLVKLAITLFLIVLSNMVVACSTSKPPTKNASHVSRKIYYKRTISIIHKYGIYSGDANIVYPYNDGTSNGPVGLAYANLVDFTGDKNEELLLLYLDNQRKVTYEVWNGNTKLAIGGCYLGIGAIDSDDISLVQTKGNLYLHWSEGGQGAGGGGLIDYFYTISRGKWVTAATVDDTWSSTDNGQVDAYSKISNGEKQAISKSMYDGILKQYTNGTKTELFTDDAGSNSFDFDTSKNNQVIRSFLANLPV